MSHPSSWSSTLSPSLVSAAPEKRLLRLPEVIHKVGFKRAYIYQLMREGTFPASVPIGKRAVGWHAHEIDAWIDAHPSRNALASSMSRSSPERA